MKRRLIIFSLVTLTLFVGCETREASVYGLWALPNESNRFSVNTNEDAPDVMIRFHPEGTVDTYAFGRVVGTAVWFEREGEIIAVTEAFDNIPEMEHVYHFRGRDLVLRLDNNLEHVYVRWDETNE